MSPTETGWGPVVFEAMLYHGLQVIVFLESYPKNFRVMLGFDNSLLRPTAPKLKERWGRFSFSAKRDRSR